jgi:N-acetylglucosamine kinase-like BadF-type ATPase
LFAFQNKILHFEKYTKTKIKPKEMRLIVDSGSTKADWIAIDEDGKVLFTTQTLGLNPEVLRIMKSLIVSMIALIFCKIKKHHSLFFYGAGCGQIK